MKAAWFHLGAVFVLRRNSLGVTAGEMKLATVCPLYLLLPSTLVNIRFHLSPEDYKLYNV